MTIPARYRAALHAAPLAVAAGRVQRRAGVVNMQVATVAPGAVYSVDDDDAKEA